jgi:hypothetical protein
VFKQIGREAACLLLLFSYFHWQCTSGNNIASAPGVCPPSYYIHNRSIATTDRKQSCTQWSTSKPTFLSSKNLDDGFGSKIWQQTRARSSSYKVNSSTLTLLLLLLLPLCFPSLLCYQGIKEIASLIAMWIEDIGLEAATNLINILMGNSMLQKIWISIPF